MNQYNKNKERKCDMKIRNQKNLIMIFAIVGAVVFITGIAFAVVRFLNKRCCVNECECYEDDFSDDDDYYFIDDDQSADISDAKE